MICIVSFHRGPFVINFQTFRERTSKAKNASLVTSLLWPGARGLLRTIWGLKRSQQCALLSQRDRHFSNSGRTVTKGRLAQGHSVAISPFAFGGARTRCQYRLHHEVAYKYFETGENFLE